MSGMAEVLAAHELALDYAEYFACTCGTIQDTANGQHHEHVAAVLSAAGFGTVKEAAAEALEDAAMELLSDESAPPKSIKEMYNAIYATWLQRRAAAVRGEG